MALLTNVSAAFMTLTTLGLLLRIYTRKVVLNFVWVDDYMAIVAWVCLMALGGINITLVHNGISEGNNSISFQKLLYSGLIFSNTGQLFTKLTFFFQFYRIVRNTNSRLRLPYLVIITLIGGWLTAQVLLAALPCVPVEAFWDKTIKGTCLDATPGRWMSSVGNIVTDFIILLFPLPVIWRLRIPRGQKFALGAVFGLGFFVCIISILRLVLSLQPPNTDAPADPSPNIAWTMAEFATGLLLACLATLRALLARFLPSWRSIISIGQSSRSRYASNSQDPHASGKYAATTTIRTTSGNWINLPDESNIEMGRLADAHAEPVSKTERSSNDWTGDATVQVVRGFEILRI
ncbi:hypothetical protein BJ170DRAFT_722288 [Xylariales sp. AK1849]|nr:hypothetical protein BJ170DRAFT_722288 [Xylariales sp. AK1849]